MPNKTVFFCGPHTCGKTTILKTLKNEGFFKEIGSEIGKDIYYIRKLVTSEQSEDFEWEVTNLELERDKKFLNISGLVGIETWHPGNLAYVAVRNPQILDKIAEAMKKSPLINSAFGIYLDIPPNTIFQRTKTFKNNREWAQNFYSEINKHLPMCFEKLGLTERIIKIDASEDFDNVLSEVKSQIVKLL